MNTTASITIEDLIREIHRDRNVSYKELFKLYEEIERAEHAVLKEEGTDGILGALMHAFDVQNYVMMTLMNQLKEIEAPGRKEVLRVLDSNLLVLQANLDSFHDNLYTPGEVHEFDKVTDQDEKQTLLES